MTDLNKLARTADQYKAARDERLKLQKEVDKLKENETALYNELHEALMENKDLDGIVGKTCVVKLVTKRVPTATDWDAVYNHIIENHAFELLQRRLSAPAVKEHWEEGETIPGIDAYDVTSLSVTKA